MFTPLTKQKIDEKIFTHKLAKNKFTQKLSKKILYPNKVP